MKEIGIASNSAPEHDPLQKRQVTQFLLGIFGLEVPSLGWLIDNKMSPIYTEALMQNDISFMEIFPLPVIILNHEGKILRVNSNACNQFRKVVEKLEGSLYLETILNNKKYDENGRYLSSILLSLETEQEFYRRYTSVDVHGSGTRTRFEVSTKLLRDEKGRITGVCGVLFELDESPDFIKSLLKTKIQLLSEKPEVAYTLNRLTNETSGTKHYLQNVSHFALELGERIGLNEYRMGELRTAAILHNIGAIGIPKNIYLKDNNLTEDEQQILKNHPLIAYEFFEGVPQFQNVARIILHHHENYDGTGYPNGLIGDKIPIESRIIAIVEEFIQSTTERSYQKQMGIREALKDIQRHNGTKFDPSIVPLFCSLINEKYQTNATCAEDVDLNLITNKHLISIYEAYILTRLVNKMFDEKFGTFAKSINLTIPQAHVVTILFFHEGLLVSEIARIGAWHISTVMSILSRLVEKGLIKYEAVEKGKGSYVFLTDQGKGSFRRMSETNKAVTCVVPAQKLEENLYQMYSVLDKYYDRQLMNQIREHIFCARRTARLHDNG